MKFIGLFILLALFGVAPLQARDYLKQERAQSRGFSPGVVTEGGKIVWVSGRPGWSTRTASRWPAISKGRRG